MRLASCATVLSMLLIGCKAAEKPNVAEQPKAAPSAVVDDARVTRADEARIAGAPGAKVWILVASDFQCPYCKEFHATLEGAIRREFVDNGVARLAFINFPLNIHPNAFPAAEAAMCAGAQGKFYPFHDRLFESQETWAPLPDARPHYESVATSLGLDVAAWKECVASNAMRAMVQADYDRGRVAGVNSTPTIIVNGEVIRGNAPIDVVREAVRKAQSGGN